MTKPTAAIFGGSVAATITGLHQSGYSSGFFIHLASQLRSLLGTVKKEVILRRGSELGSSSAFTPFPSPLAGALTYPVKKAVATSEIPAAPFPTSPENFQWSSSKVWQHTTFPARHSEEGRSRFTDFGQIFFASSSSYPRRYFFEDFVLPPSLIVVPTSNVSCPPDLGDFLVTAVFFLGDSVVTDRILCVFACGEVEWLIRIYLFGYFC